MPPTLQHTRRTSGELGRWPRAAAVVAVEAEATPTTADLLALAATTNPLDETNGERCAACGDDATAKGGGGAGGGGAGGGGAGDDGGATRRARRSAGAFLSARMPTAADAMWISRKRGAAPGSARWPPPPRGSFGGKRPATPVQHRASTRARGSIGGGVQRRATSHAGIAA